MPAQMPLQQYLHQQPIALVGILNLCSADLEYGHMVVVQELQEGMDLMQQLTHSDFGCPSHVSSEAQSGLTQATDNKVSRNFEKVHVKFMNNFH